MTAPGRVSGTPGKNSPSSKTDRRSFIKLSTLGVLASGGAVLVGTQSAQAKPARIDVGYHETDHIREYYRTARF